MSITPKQVKFKNVHSSLLKRYPEFKPNLTPKQIFLLGSFHDQGGYWRPISSVFFKGKLHDVYKKYTKKGKCLEGVPKHLLITPSSEKTQKDKMKHNRYNVKAGSRLDYWHKKHWIKKQDPYGWVQWYCEFYDGRQSPDDERQIQRWIKFAGEHSGRFRKNLMNKILRKKATYDDESVSPVIRQSLQHWGYQLTKSDLNRYIRFQQYAFQFEKGLHELCL